MAAWCSNRMQASEQLGWRADTATTQTAVSSIRYGVQVISPNEIRTLKISTYSTSLPRIAFANCRHLYLANVNANNKAVVVVVVVVVVVAAAAVVVVAVNVEYE